MDTQSWLMLRILINRYNPKAGNALLKFLPEEEAAHVLKQDIHSTDIFPLLAQPKYILELMHYSWLQPIIEAYPHDFQSLLLGVLSHHQTSKLQLSSEKTPYSVSLPVKNFLIHQLYANFHNEHPLPLDYLPETDMTVLAKLSKNELVDMINFLGLHDLTAKIRGIVNKQHLENIYTSLTPKQLRYLKICLYQKEKLDSPPLDINPAEKNKDKLGSIIHQRGLARLGKALCGEHKDLVWYIVHILDRGRGKILQGYYQEQSIPKVTSILRTQVMHVMNFIKKE